MKTLTVLAVLAHFFTLGRAGPFSRLFCDTRCNPNPNEPLNQCFFSCGFLRYGKYYDGSVCWYFSRLGQAFAATGYCSQGMCLKIFTGGYNGSDAQRQCGDIPPDAPWLKNMTKTSQRPAFNLSDATQETQVRSNETSASVSQTASFEPTITEPPITTAISLGNASLSYERVLTTPFNSTLLSTAYMTTDVPGAKEGSTRQQPANVKFETGTLNASFTEPEGHTATTENSIQGLTTTDREPATAIVSATAAGTAYAEQPVTEAYPESYLDTLAHRPPVIETTASPSYNRTGKNRTEHIVDEFTHPFAETTVSPITRYSATKNTRAGRINGTEKNEGATEQSSDSNVHPPGTNDTEAIERPAVETAVSATVAVAPAEQPSDTSTENPSAGLMPPTGKGNILASTVGATELATVGTELPGTSSLPFTTEATSTELNPVRSSAEITTENVSGTPASWGVTTTEYTTPASVLENPISTVTSTEGEAVTVTSEATQFITNTTVPPTLQGVSKVPHTNGTTDFKSIAESPPTHVAIATVTPPGSASITAHQNEIVYSTTLHPNIPNVSGSLGEPEILPATETTINLAATVTSATTRSHQNETFEAVIQEPPSNEEVPGATAQNDTTKPLHLEPASNTEGYLDVTAGEAYNATPPSVARSSTTNEFAVNFNVTRAPRSNFSGHTSTFEGLPSTETILLKENEPSSLTTVPAEEVTGGENETMQVYTTITAAYPGIYKATTEIPLSVSEALTTKEATPVNEIPAYTHDHEKNDTNVEHRTVRFQNTNENENVTMTTVTRRSKQNKTDALVSSYTLIIAMTIIKTCF